MTSHIFFMFTEDYLLCSFFEQGGTNFTVAFLLKLQLMNQKNFSWAEF